MPTSIRRIYTYGFYLFIFVFGIAHAYLFLICAAGMTIALGIFAFFIYISYFVSGWVFISILDTSQNRTKKIHQASYIGLTFFTIVLTIVAQQNNFFDGLGYKLSITSVGALLGGFALGLSSSITLKSINLLRHPKQKAEIHAFSWRDSNFLIGISNGILIGVAWGLFVSPNFGFMVGIVFGATTLIIRFVSYNRLNQLQSRN